MGGLLDLGWLVSRSLDCAIREIIVRSCRVIYRVEHGDSFELHERKSSQAPESVATEAPAKSD